MDVDTGFGNGGSAGRRLGYDCRQSWPLAAFTRTPLDVVRHSGVAMVVIVFCNHLICSQAPPKDGDNCGCGIHCPFSLLLYTLLVGRLKETVAGRQGYSGQPGLVSGNQHTTLPGRGRPGRPPFRHSGPVTTNRSFQTAFLRDRFVEMNRRASEV